MSCASFVCRVLLLIVCTPAIALAQTHPLDPLTAAEIDAVSGALRASSQFPDGGQFAALVLKEPPKNAVLAYAPGAAIPRQAFAVILDRKGNRTFEAVVDLPAARVASWTEVKGVQPVVLEAEYETLVRIVKADTRWQEAMRKRGIDDLDDVQIDDWAVGQVAPRSRDGACFARCPTSRATSDEFLRPADRRRRSRSWT